MQLGVRVAWLRVCLVEGSVGATGRVLGSRWLLKGHSVGRAGFL